MLCEKDIIQIETTINENREILNNLNWDSNEPFKFKLGHKSLILRLPNIIKSYLESKKRKTEINKEKNETVVKTELKNKLSNYMRRHSYEVQFTSSNIIEFEKIKEEKNIYRCRIVCVFCGKSVAAKYKNHWMVSNFETHLRKHVLESSQISKSGNSTQIPSGNNSSDIREILGLD